MNNLKIVSNDKYYSVEKTNKKFVIDIFYYVFYIAILYMPIWVVANIMRHKICTKNLILFSLVFVCFLLFIFKKYMTKRLITICKVNSLYFINNICFNNTEIINLILYEFYGEPLLDKEGHLYIKIKNKKFIICYSVSSVEFDEIIKSLEVFFNVKYINIERKKLICPI